MSATTSTFDELREVRSDSAQATTRPWQRAVSWVRRHARTALALLLLLVLMFPFLWLMQIAFRPAEAAFDDSLLFAPTLEAFRALWQGNFARSFGNSLLVSGLSTVLSLLLGVPAAYALTRWRFRARRRVALWILMTRMAPPIAFTIPFFLAYRWLGLLDTVWGLALVYLTFNLAVVIWLMQGFFEAVPQALEEAAWIDGCGVWSAFWRVTLPLTAPGLAATAVLCFIFSWNDFFYALILTRTQAVTAPVAIVNFLQYEGWEWTKIAAGGTLVMLPVVVFTMLVRKYLVRGLTAGGVKD
ncbi:carbohydrate ABC transporter permease [Cupriavidus respiraculi]|uniref:Trehalose transport system permease protein SugB n=1 Tax=Cupriavidus respiraculi TaxID=195930 RepID=A0ABM8WN91_9BURK|nr:carbohydrate ABC transporter permease [Cupriavidus respiraculi]MBY4947277.1 carbohydrate ABC transporter permease [Cupriavidus respiraculi]CAG9168863.1 Trehalose transport system permease protein SugB [Cupriavidus respiraculi]